VAATRSSSSGSGRPATRLSNSRVSISPQTAKTPGAGYHFLNCTFFDLIGWREFREMPGENLIERALRFMLEYHSLRQPEGRGLWR
jgi:hypothetical protein